MSKRWKVRKQNAAKREASKIIIAEFHDNIMKALSDAAKDPRTKSLVVDSLPSR